MILQPAGVSPSRNAAPQNDDQQNIPQGVEAQRIADAAQREDALLKMRHKLAHLDLSQRRMSIEDWMAALMGEADAELPA
jgi:hypothetical protein